MTSVQGVKGSTCFGRRSIQSDWGLISRWQANVVSIFKQIGIFAREESPSARIVEYEKTVWTLEEAPFV